MKIVKIDSKNNSGAMSPTKRQLLRQRKNERSFLADQAADAKTAMIQTLHDMTETIKKVADVRLIAKQHPWLVIGSAVAAGFATGAALTPSPRKKIEKTGSNSEGESQSSCQGRESSSTNNSFLFSTVAKVLAGIVQTVIQASIAGAAGAVVAKDQPPVETPLPHDSTQTVVPEIGTD